MSQFHPLDLIETSDGGVGSMRDEIAGVLAQVLGRPVSITDDTDIVEDLGLDSLRVMDFVMAIEDHFDLSIPLDRVAQIRTVSDLMDAIRILRAGNAA